jgi:hypothetical protein
MPRRHLQSHRKTVSTEWPATDLHSLGFKHVTVRCGAKHGHKVYRLPFANGRLQVALQTGRTNARRDAILRSLGWTLIRL